MSAKDILGGLLVVIGMGLLYLGLSMDTSLEVSYPEISTSLNIDLPERVNNLGLMQEKQNYLMFGGICFILGLVLVYAFPNSKSEENEGVKKCPKCAENIKKEAEICRYCSHSFVEKENINTKNENNIDYRFCPACKNPILINEKECSDCGLIIIE